MITGEEAVRALESVRDPHAPVSLRPMRMLDGVDVDDGGVRIRVCVPCLACPAASLLTSQIQQILLAHQDLTGVDVELGWHLPWDRDSVDHETRELVPTAGIQL